MFHLLAEIKAAYLAWVFALPFWVQLTIGIALVLGWCFMIFVIQRRAWRSAGDLRFHDWRFIAFMALFLAMYAFPPAWLVLMVLAVPATALAVGWSLSH